MAKNGSNKRKPGAKPGGQKQEKKSSRDNAKETKSGANKRTTGNVGGFKSGQVQKGKTPKVRVNDINTGRLIWIEQSKLKAYEKQKLKAYTQREEAKKRETAKFFDKRIKDSTGDLYEDAQSRDDIAKIIRYKKGIRDAEGRFITKEAQDAILKFAGILEREGVEFNLRELLSVPQIEAKILITEDKIPKETFYWNLQNKTQKGVYGEPLIIIKGFDGEIIYKGKSEVKAVHEMNKLNRKIENLNKVIEEKEDTDAYFTVPTFETKRDGEIIKIESDYSQIVSRLPKDIHDKYRTML